MRTPSEVRRVMELWEQGLNQCEISRVVGIPRATIKDWVNGKRPSFERRHECPLEDSTYLPARQKEYVYLLGLYLGDGCITVYKAKTPRLRIACCDAYPYLMDRCEQAMGSVLANKILRIPRVGYTEVMSNSKHWPCLFPQHGPGRKHERKIELTPWQQELIDIDPWPLIEGLIHSDGCRVLNRVKGTAYPRYHFSNASADIRQIFMNSCNAVGVDCRPNNARNLSVARRESVALMDAHIAPKR